MHIMWELATNKPNFLFKNTKDFNQTTHVGPQEPIIIIDNIILYFNYLIFVQHVFKRSCNGMSQEGCQTSDFFVKMQVSLCTFYFTTLPTWWTLQISVVWNCKYSLPISNPNILF